MKIDCSRRDFLGAAMLAAGGCVTRKLGGMAAMSGEGRWYKGMLHCHSYWSDGRAFPEQAVAAYRELGYDFMSLTDHNRLSARKDKWRVLCEKEGGWPPNVTPRQFDNLKRRFPWTKTRTNKDGKLEVRLTPYAELIEHFNEPGRFLVIPGCEVTRGTGDWEKGRQVHMNSIGLEEVIPSARYAYLVQDTFRDHSVATLIRATREECETLAAARGNPPHIFTVDHPQWPYYDVLPADLIDNPEVRFFEVRNNGSQMGALPEFHRFNGHDNDRFWDVVNAFRARACQPLLFATAVDDAHWYHNSGVSAMESGGCYSGDGWIKVRAKELSAASLFAAMERGDFYASCGIDLDDVTFDGKTLRVRVPAIEGVACKVKFIVTKRDFDDRVIGTAKSTKDYLREVPIHSDEIGQVVKECEAGRDQAIDASYTLANDDLYVRARIESDKLSPFASWQKKLSGHPLFEKFATAWTQPYSR